MICAPLRVLRVLCGEAKRDLQRTHSSRKNSRVRCCVTSPGWNTRKSTTRIRGLRSISWIWLTHKEGWAILRRYDDPRKRTKRLVLRVSFRAAWCDFVDRFLVLHSTSVSSSPIGSVKTTRVPLPLLPFSIQIRPSCASTMPCSHQESKKRYPIFRICNMKCAKGREEEKVEADTAHERCQNRGLRSPRDGTKRTISNNASATVVGLM